MLDTEYNEAEIKELFKAEGREEGSDIRARDIAKRLLRKGNDIASVAEDTELSQDIVIQLAGEITKESL